MKNLSQMMKQAQEMQDRMQEMQAQMDALEVEGSAGGGMVQVVITGKGGRRLRLADALPLAHRTRRDVDPEGGVLKRMVPLWLDGPDLSPLVQAFSPATDRHGGAGALYVLLRRVRATS